MGSTTKRRRRRPSYRKKSGVFATPAGFSLGGFAGARSSILKAAEVIAAQARSNASAFSTRIAPATEVQGMGELQAMVVTDGSAAPNAAPFEFGERHPLFGDRKHWYKQPQRAYMARAANNGSALEAAAQVFGDEEAALLATEFGFTE